MTSKPQTVLHVIAHLEKGGAERQLRLLVEASRHDHVIAVLAGNEAPCAAPVETIANLNFGTVTRRIADIIEQRGITIAQMWLPARLTIPAAIAARRAGLPIISGDRRKPRGRGINAIKDRLGYGVHLMADRIVPNYPYIMPPVSLRRVTGMRSKLQVIPNGMAFDAAAPVPANPAPDRLLFAGRLVEQKNAGLLLEAMAMPRIAERVRHLDIVGEGPLDAALRAKTRALGLEERVTFHGFCEDWHTRFSPQTHMLILPSGSEGMSNTLFEGIAHGFLPIVTRSAELDAMISDWAAGPVFIETLNTAGTASAIAEAISLPSAQIAERAGQMRAGLEQFSIPAMAANYDALYDELGGELGGAA